jgi:hypothetical protein
MGHYRNKFDGSFVQEAIGHDMKLVFMTYTNMETKQSTGGRSSHAYIFVYL